MPRKGTTDVIFEQRQVMVKHREKRKDINLVFIDLDKAYARVLTSESMGVFDGEGNTRKVH